MNKNLADLTIEWEALIEESKTTANLDGVLNRIGVVWDAMLAESKREKCLSETLAWKDSTIDPNGWCGEQDFQGDMIDAAKERYAKACHACHFGTCVLREGQK